MQLKYRVDDIPPLSELLLFGLQWFAISIPGIVIIGKVVGGLHYPDGAMQIAYLQKLAFMVGIVLIAQVLAGHRLPLILGPSTVLLIGILASSGFGLGTIYTSIMIGGLLLFLVAVTGLFGRLRALFTGRVVTVVLLLIAFTLLPTVLALITPAGPVGPTRSLSFALLLVLCMFVAQRYLPAIWRSSIIFWAMVLGTLAWYLLFGFPVRTPGAQLPVVAQFLGAFTTSPSVAPGVLVSFLFCFLGLAINDLGSIESVAVLLKPGNMDGRMDRGVAITGLANIAAGFVGVIGPVNFSLSPGVIMSTGCASRFTLIPTGVLLAALSFSPLVLGILGGVPSVVIGATLIYILAYQMAAGLSTAAAAKEGLTLETGIVIGLSVLVGTIVGFLPAGVSMGFPAVLRPIIGNGFVMGMLTAFVLEHGVYRHSRA